MISLRIDRLRAGSADVIQDFRFETEARALLVTGATGTGKTLVARALAGDFRDTSWIRVHGSAQLAHHAMTLPRADGVPRVGYLPQTSTAFFIGSSVMAEILTAQYCSAQTPKAAEDRTRGWRDTSPLASRSNLPPLALSGGQQRLLMLETVLSTAPDHLVVDGGMPYLDKEFAQRAVTLVQDWLDQDPSRTLISLATPPDLPWFRFGASVSLGTGVRPNRITNGRARINSDRVLLLFDSISAGPMIDRRRLIQNATLRVREGEFVGLGGRNGVGKSTLLRLVAGVRRAARGEVHFLGKPLRRLRWPGLTGGIGYIPQEPELAGPGAFSRSFLRRARKPDQQLWEHWQRFFGLSWAGDLAGYWSLSSGERMRASLMYQAAHKPRLWILDEPTARLEASEVADFLMAVREIDPSAGAIVVSHEESVLKTMDTRYELTESGIVPVTAP